MDYPRENRLTELAETHNENETQNRSAGNGKVSSTNEKLTIEIAAGMADGNLVIYDRSLAKALWESGTSGHRGAFLAVQEDGNVVIYTPERKPVWATATHGKL